MVYGTQITIVTGAYKPTNITGGPHIVAIDHIDPWHSIAILGYFSRRHFEKHTEKKWCRNERNRQRWRLVNTHISQWSCGDEISYKN